MRVSRIPSAYLPLNGVRERRRTEKSLAVGGVFGFSEQHNPGRRLHDERRLG